MAHKHFAHRFYSGLWFIILLITNQMFVHTIMDQKQCTLIFLVNRLNTQCIYIYHDFMQCDFQIEHSIHIYLYGTKVYHSFLLHFQYLSIIVILS